MHKKDAQHLILQELIRISSELGRLPSRNEFFTLSRITDLQFALSYESWTTFVQSTGLAHTKGKERPSQEEIRKKCYEHLLREKRERGSPRLLPPLLYSHIFVWGDRHHPYAHPDTIPWLIAINRKYKFDLVIDIGDGEDFHAMSFHEHDPDIYSAGFELEKVIEEYQPLYQEFPEVMICESNHGSMVWRKAKHHGFPRQVIKPYKEVLKAPEGWTWHNEIVVQMTNGEKCLFHHGLSANVLLASQKRGMSLVQGHYHSKFGTQWWQNLEKSHFAAQTGCLIDDAAYAFAYNKTTIERPILGSLRIERGVPHQLPMFLDRHGRWTGEIP